jgi:hypothetical protein
MIRLALRRMIMLALGGMIASGGVLVVTKAMPPVMPAPKLSPTGPGSRRAAGHVLAAVRAAALDHGDAPELRTAKRSPAWPAANSRPAVAP